MRETTEHLNHNAKTEGAVHDFPGRIRASPFAVAELSRSRSGIDEGRATVTTVSSTTSPPHRSHVLRLGTSHTGAFVTDVDVHDEKPSRAVQRVLDTLDMLDARTDEHYSRSRNARRHNWRGQVTLCIPNPDDPIVRVDESHGIPAWGRSLSETGMALIHTEPIDTPVVFVGVDTGSGKTWFQAQIVRRREIDGFHEFGVAFRGRS